MRQAYRNALVTGASSGIGESIARALAARGCDLVLVARRGELLDRLAAELSERHRIGTEVIAADLTGSEGVAAVERRLSGASAPVELLVNNAGFGTSGRFAELDVEREDEEIRLNVLALVRLTHAALPGMIARGHGGILNVSSMAGFVPSGANATYNATKAFVTSFSESLHVDLRREGVHVTALCPGFTRTGFQDVAGVSAAARLPGVAWLDADQVARDGLDGVSAGRAIVVPGTQYKVLTPLTRLVPRAAIRAAVGRVMG